MFPYLFKEEATGTTSFKWKQGNSQYEIAAVPLDELDLPQLLHHCLDVKSKVEGVVSTENHIPPSLFRIFPSTLSLTIRVIWEECKEELAPEETLDGFKDLLQQFIAAHATQDDQHELVQQLMRPKKPREVKVQAFSYALRKLNGYIEWLPGTAAKLTGDQLMQAFFDAMPASWRDKFVSAGLNQQAP